MAEANAIVGRNDVPLGQQILQGADLNVFLCMTKIVYFSNDPNFDFFRDPKF